LNDVPHAIQLRGVDQVFAAKAGPVHALSGVSLDIDDGEFIAVVGASGCGKSTLLRILAGLLAPSAGEVMIDGRQVSGPDPRIGIVFQTPVLLPWRSVARNIELQIEIRGLDREGHAPKIAELIRLVGLSGFESMRPFELSGGMQQRVALCRALIHNPSLLLMDEPFGALDALTREQMNLELQRIWLETKKTVVFITHSILEAVFLADRIVVMTPRPGRVQEIVSVAIPRPRGFESLRDPAFHAANERVRALMNASGMSE